MGRWQDNNVLFDNGKEWLKQPGYWKWQRADWCSYRAAEHLAKASACAEYGDTDGAKKNRIQAMRLFKEHHKCRKEALMEGFQPRSKEGMREAARLEAKLTPLERAFRHRRQAMWAMKMRNRGYDLPKWVNPDVYTPEDVTLVYEHEHPGRKLA